MTVIDLNKWTIEKAIGKAREKGFHALADLIEAVDAIDEDAECAVPGAEAARNAYLETLIEYARKEIGE